MKYVYLTAALILGAFALPGISHAQVVVDFETLPLFGETNFIPGDTVTKKVKVTNNYSETKNVYTELVNVSDGDGLGDVINVEIIGGNAFAATFASYDAAGKVNLGALSSGAAVIYSFKMTFQPAAGNEYQNDSLGFDLCVGLDGGEFECDDFEDDTPNNPIDPDPDGSGDGNGNGNPTTSSTPNPDDEPTDNGTPGDLQDTFFGGLGGGFPFGDFIGEVQGASTGTDDAATSTGAEPVGLVASVGAAGSALLNSIDCTFFWLILLVVISMSWSTIEDRLGKNGGLFGVFFTRNVIFTIVYIIGLVIFQLMGMLESFQWIFAGMWTVMTAYDYWGHKKIADFWNSHRRNFYFGALALAFAALGLFTPLLCVWVPFVIVMLISTLLYFLDE